MTLTIPSHLTALSNMPELETLHLSSGKKLVQFSTSPIMSTYLLAFVVGEFDFVEGLTDHGVKIRVYTPPGKAAQGKFSLECGRRALDLYDDFFGVKYPLPKLDMIAIPEFAAGLISIGGFLFFFLAILLLFFSHARMRYGKLGTCDLSGD